MKKILAAFSVASLLPLSAFAATAQELQQQIQTLLQQVQALQQQQGGSSTTAAVPVSGGQCPLISRTLKRGHSGSDVTRLQQFLARDPLIYPEAQVTGFFGALTETAVKKFQCKNQIVCDGTPDSTGYGVVGPRTAAILALQCPAGGGGGGGGGGDSADVGGFIRVNPIQGTAPLNVSVDVTVNTTRSCAGASYQLLYGDNTPPVNITVPPQQCVELRQTYNHTYTGGGSFIMTLRSGGHQTSATVNVAAQGFNEDSLAISPTSGEAPLNVSFTGKANASGSCSPQPYSLNFGDGTTANIPVTNCSVSTYAVTHGYTQSGTFIARLMRGGSQVMSNTVRVSAGPGAQGGGSFSVSPGYGGDAFAVLASFQLASSCTAYDIDWGDGTAHSTQGAGTCGAGQINKEVSHTFSGNGTYTVTLKRGSGSTQTTDTAGVSVVY